MSDGSRHELPEWAKWPDPDTSTAYTIGIEEEVMLLDPMTWALAHRIDTVLPRLPHTRENRFNAETHGSALEIQTGVHESVASAVGEIGELRCELEAVLKILGLAAASAGTHPFAVWQEIVISAGERYQFVHGSMRELARREPTFALHVHVGVPDSEAAIRAANRIRLNLPLLLALSVNSPYWQGRDTGLASARTPLFQAFPRVGIPRAFENYADYAEAVDVLIRSDAVPEPTFLWWDVRPQPQFGTVETRIMDAQTTIAETAALTALVQCIVHSEAEGDPAEFDPAPEVLAENRFLAARDGMDAELIEQHLDTRVPARELVARLLENMRPHATELGCEEDLERVNQLSLQTGASHQLNRARALGSLPRLIGAIAADFTAGAGC